MWDAVFVNVIVFCVLLLEIVISCDWFDILRCDVDPEYKYDKKVYRDHINIRIPDATEKLNITYECKVNGEKNPGNCSFTASQSKFH